jgi:hypothetical protein
VVLGFEFYHLSHSWPFLLQFFFRWDLTSCLGPASDIDPPTCLLHSWDDRNDHHAWLVFWDGVSLTFCPDWSRMMILPMSASQAELSLKAIRMWIVLMCPRVTNFMLLWGPWGLSSCWMINVLTVKQGDFPSLLLPQILGLCPCSWINSEPLNRVTWDTHKATLRWV